MPGAEAVPRQRVQQEEKALLATPSSGSASEVRGARGQSIASGGGNSQLRLSLRGIGVSPSQTVNGEVNDIAMCQNHPLDLGRATANMGDKDALPGDRFLRI